MSKGAGYAKMIARVCNAKLNMRISIKPASQVVLMDITALMEFAQVDPFE